MGFQSTFKTDTICLDTSTPNKKRNSSQPWTLSTVRSSRISFQFPTRIHAPESGTASQIVLRTLQSSLTLSRDTSPANVPVIACAKTTTVTLPVDSASLSRCALPRTSMSCLAKMAPKLLNWWPNETIHQWISTTYCRLELFVATRTWPSSWIGALVWRT